MSKNKLNLNDMKLNEMKKYKFARLHLILINLYYVNMKKKSYHSLVYPQMTAQHIHKKWPNFYKFINSKKYQEILKKAKIINNLEVNLVYNCLRK